MVKGYSSKPDLFVWFEFICGGFLGMIASFPFSSELMYSISLYIFMVVGVSIVGYFHYKSINRLTAFRKAIVMSIVGLVIFLISYFLLDYFYLKGGWPSLSILMPLIGTVIGINLIFFRNKARST
jgi:FtsH-binding integral membrane protein